MRKIIAASAILLASISLTGCIQVTAQPTTSGTRASHCLAAGEVLSPESSADQIQTACATVLSEHPAAFSGHTDAWWTAYAESQQ